MKYSEETNRIIDEAIASFPAKWELRAFHDSGNFGFDRQACYYDSSKEARGDGEAVQLVVTRNGEHFGRDSWNLIKHEAVEI